MKEEKRPAAAGRHMKDVFDSDSCCACTNTNKALITCLEDDRLESRWFGLIWDQRQSQSLTLCSR